MNEERYQVDNSAGWTLDIRRFYDPHLLQKERRPVVMVPGYCMNSFILNFHPTGTSMIASLVEAGFEVWAANLRGQGDSRQTSPRVLWRREGYGFAALGLVDLPAALKFVRENTACDTDQVDLVGCSLGAPVSYVYLAHHPEDHGVGALVNIGGPLRWNLVHPLVARVLTSPRLASLVPVRGTRRAARLALPIAQRFPWLLSFYMNPSIIDLSAADELVKTIDDPNRKLTGEIARWVRNRDLMVRGRNVCHSLYSVDIPLLCIIAGQDGIVNPESALSILDHIGSHDVEVLEVGTDEMPHAHADLFISEGVQKRVFDPLVKWLQKQAGSTIQEEKGA